MLFPSAGAASGDGPVVGLCSAGCEINLFGVNVCQPGEESTAVLEDLTGIGARPVDRAGVSEVCRSHRSDYVDYLRKRRRRGGIVKVDHI